MKPEYKAIVVLSLEMLLVFINSLLVVFSIISLLTYWIGMLLIVGLTTKLAFYYAGKCDK